LEFYKRALSIRPNDLDFKANLEIAEKKKKEQPQQPSGGKQQPQKNQAKQDSSSKGTPPNNPQGKPQDQKRQEEPQEPVKPSELTKQEAERLLDAVKDQEREPQKKRRVAVTGRRYRGEEW
jgi:hypothetical protein